MASTFGINSSLTRNEDKFPDKADTFRFRYHGLFYVAPAQNSFMLRCRIPAGELTSAQMRGLADIAEQWGGGYADITTRANIQIREIAPRHIVKCLLKLQEIGLTSRGSGVDNVRNVTATPTAGIDKDELIDTGPLAKGVHHYILQQSRHVRPAAPNSTSRSTAAAQSASWPTRTNGFIAVRVAEGKGVGPGHLFPCRAGRHHRPRAICEGLGHARKAERMRRRCRCDPSGVCRAWGSNESKKGETQVPHRQLGHPEIHRRVQRKLVFQLLRLPSGQCEPRRAPDFRTVTSECLNKLNLALTTWGVASP